MAEGKPFPWRTMALVLAGALVLTLAGAAGAYLGGARLERWGPEHGPRGGGPGFAAGREGQAEPRPLAALSAEQRRAVRRQIGDALRAAASRRQDAQAAREAVLQAAQAEPYDPEALRQALAQMRSADEAVNAAVHDALAEGMAGLSVEEREALLVAAARMRGRWGRDAREPSPEPPEAPRGP